MDRTIITAGQKPRSADTLVFERMAMTGLSYLTQSLLGVTTTLASGLVASPGPGLTVAIAPGAFYQLAALDATSYGSLAANTSDFLLKQGLQLTSPALSGFAAPGSVGQSINYLIEAQYQDVDTTPVLLQFVNSSNPTQFYNGIGGLGATNYTIRSGAIAYQVKAGSAALTGAQTTPAADSGWTGLYVVEVRNGQSSIPSGQINPLANAPFLAGLLNQHHKGIPGQAPQIDLTNEVQNILAVPHLPVSPSIGGYLDTGQTTISIGMPVTPYAGTGKTYAAADRGAVYVRQNSGINMIDTLPASGVANGWLITIYNLDSFASLRINSPSQFNGVLGGYMTLAYGQSVMISCDGSGYFWSISNLPIMATNAGIYNYAYHSGYVL